MGNNVFLVGGAGTGKTTLAQNVTTALGRQYITINCSQYTTPTEIIGGQTMDGYQEGKLIEAWQNGLVLILDEIPKIDPNTAGLLNDALAKSKTKGALIFNSRKEHFTRHPNFAVIATGNVWPIAESMNYSANNKQDLSLLDRFSGSVYQIEKNPDLEIIVLGSKSLWAVCDKFRNALETLKIETPVSLRFMLNARDSFVLMADRLAKNENSKAKKGKTFSDVFRSFLEVNLTKFQQNVLFSTMKVYDVVENENLVKLITNELISSGYLNNTGSASGLGKFPKRYNYRNYVVKDGD